MTPEETLRQALLEDKFPETDAEPLIPMGDPLKLNRRVASAAWMGNLTGREINSHSIGWQAEKDNLAREFFKIPTAKDMSDESIHDLIRSHIQTSDNTTNLALESALSGRPLPQALSELHALTGVAKTRGIRDRYLNEASSIYGNVAAKVAPYRGIIKEAAGTLSKEMDFAVPTTDAFQSVAEKLLQVPEKDRRIVIEAIGATGGATAEERSSYLNKVAATLGRYSEMLGGRSESMVESISGTVQQLANAPAEIASLLSGGNMGIQSQAAGAGERSKATEAELNRVRDLQLLTDDIRKIASQKVDPVKGNGWVQQLGLDVASMIPQTAVAIANPTVGYAANLAYFRDDIASNFKAQNPGTTTAQADKVSAVAAPVNAAIETVTALIPWGKVKLPVLQKWLMSETASVGGAARNFGIRAITGTGAEIGEEWLQAYAPLKAQELMSGLKQDMPSVDWEKNMPKFADIAAEVWAPALLFSLVGGGVASINDIKNGRSLASDLDMLVAKGVAPETAAKIKEASDAGDYNKVDSLFRAEFVSEIKASKPDIQAATERLKARFKAQENVEALTETTSPEYTASVTRTPSGWQVTTGDGTIIPAETAEGANRIYNGLRQSGSLKEAQVFAETLDAAYASGMARGAAVNLTGETVTSDSRSGLVTAVRIDENKAPIPGSERYFGPGALDTIHKEAEVAGFKSGTQNVSFHINGSNEAFPSRVADTAKGIWRMINIFKAKKDGLPMITTFLHEDIESKFRLGLANGAWSKEDARTAFRALAPAFANIAEPVGKSADEVASMSKASRQKYEEDLDAKKLEYEWVKNVRKIVDGNMDDTLVRETFSEMYVRNAYALDRRGRNTGLPPGQISRALEAAVVGANTNEEASALVRIIAVFRALSAHLKAVFGTVKAMVKARDNGTIGEDWDAFVDKVLGIDEVKRDEGLAMNEAQAILEDSDMPFSISPAFSVSQDIRPLKESDLSTGWLSYPTPKGELTKAKIIKYLKDAVNKPSSRKRLAKFVMSYDDAQDLLDHTYYHGTSNFISSTVKPSITLSDKKAEEMGGGGYGEKYWAISLSKSKRKAESFSGQSRSVNIHPVLLKKSAKVISMPDVTDAADLDDHILDLWKNQVDAVWIGGGEEELAVINPKSIVFSQDSDSYAVFGGFKSENFTLQKAEAVRNQAQSIIDNYSDESPQKLSFSVSIPTSSIDTIPEDLARAEADMKAGGKDWAAKVDLSQPVGVYRGEDGRLKLFDGHHRWLAARERGEPLQVRESVFGRAVPIGEAPVVADMPDGAQLVGPATFSITAYHGTPHKVDKFTTAKIGTGEGAQAFGWGLYFAAAKKVAEQYRKELSRIVVPDDVAAKSNVHKALAEMVNEGMDIGVAADKLRKFPWDQVREARDEIAKLPRSGNLYTVELLPDEADFLDWDKPLSEQSEKVKAALASTGLFTPRDLNPPANFVPSPLFNSGRGAYDILKSNEESDEKASKLLASLGIAGMKYFDGNSRNIEFGTRNYVIFDESLVKILEENGQKVEGQSFSISPVTPAQDAEYLAAVEAGDMTKAQAMVDEAATGKGPFYHRSGAKGIKEFYPWTNFGTEEQAASVDLTGRSDGTSETYKVYLDIRNPLRVEDQGMSASNVMGQAVELGVASSKEYAAFPFNEGDDVERDNVIKLLQSKGYDGLVYANEWEGEGDSYITFSPNQIKSADPVTRDESGKAIPLSQRFNEATPDIRFSISPIRNLNELSDQVERQFAENPVKALEVKSRMIRQFAKYADKWSQERWTPQGNKIRPISDKRTVKSLDKEQAMRQAQREVELVNEGIDKLTPETLMAWSQGVDALDDHPLIQEMLGKHGKLMSLRTAQKEGKDIKDQYDDAPWIPPQWYAKSGGIMPDVMADNLKFGYAKDMWAEIESVIKTYRDTKEDYAKAEAAVKAVEKAAFEQARKEAQAWRDEADAMQKEDWSPKESLVRDLITLEAIVAMFPQEVRGKIGGFVTLARKASESARLKVLQKQLERGQVLLEKHLKEQYNVSLLKMLDKAAPVGKPGEVKKSKFIVTVQDELDAISEIVGMDSDDVTESITTNEAAIISAQTPEAADVALTRLNLLELFGGILDLKRTSSQEMEVAHEYLAKLMKQGREARKMIDEARSAKVKEMVAMAKADAFKGQTGPETTQAARAKAAKESGRAMLRKFFGELSGFDAVLRDAFGPKSETARSFSERFTLNSNDFEDVQNERRTRFRDFARELYQTKLGAKINQKLIKLERIEKNSSVTYLKNREVKTHKFTESDAAKIVADPKAFGFTDKDAAAISEEIQAIQDSGGRRKVFTYDQIINDGDRVEIPLSQMDAVYISMALRQPGILEQQERHGYDQQTVDELDKYLTDEAKAWRRWMQTEYDAEYQRANEVYMRMFNARMPMIMFYAPLLKNHQGQQAILDPLNTGISSNSANPGSIKTRKGRTSSLRIESALTVFWAHFNQMEYWIANAEYLRDVQAVLLNPEVRESVVASHGEDGMATISAWIQLQMSRGVGKAALATVGNKLFRNVKTGLTMKALALSYTTALKTLPSVFYSLGETHMSKWPSALVSGMTHWNRLWKTNIIQRRLDIGGMPELRDLGSSAMPMSWMNQLIKYGSAPAMYADAVFTTFSAAMAYGVNYDEAIRQGASEELAHNHAEERTALIVSRTAQPENWTQKSLLENDVGAFGSMFTLFMSDPRQKMALTGAALNQFRKGNVTGEEAARKFLAYWVIPGIMFQLANAIGRSLFKGDDDEWEVVDFATAALVGQLQGLVLLGSGVEMIFSTAIAAAAEKITGEEVKRKPFWNSSKNPLDQAAQDLIKSAENLNDTDKDVFEKTWEVIKSAGMLTTWLNPAGAVPATVERVIKDTMNLFYGADEK